MTIFLRSRPSSEILSKLDWALEEYYYHNIRSESQIDHISSLIKQCQSITVSRLIRYCEDKKMSRSDARRFLRLITLGVEEL